MQITSRSPIRQATPSRRPSPVVRADRFIPAAEEWCPPTPPKLSLLSKAALVGGLGLTFLTSLNAHAGPVNVANVQVARANLRDLAVTVLPQGTPRIDLIRADRDQSRVGASLGQGLFVDIHGNLSLLPLESLGWDRPPRDFQRVDLNSKQSVQRYGSSVQFAESSTRRTIFSEHDGSLEMKGPHGQAVFLNLPHGQIKVTGGKSGEFLVDKGLATHIRRPGQPEITVVRGPDSLEVLKNNQLTGSARLQADGSLLIQNGKDTARVTRSASGTILQVDGKGRLEDARIVRDGDVYLGRRDKDTMTVDDQKLLAESKARYDMVMQQLEQVEPGFAEKHPMVASVLEYASANPRLLGAEADHIGFLQAGTLLASTGGALETVSALGAQAAALNLANSARALGAAALSAQAAAQAQAAAGNLAQASKLAADAQNFANRAHQARDQAIKTGGKALKAARLARIMAGVGGLLQIVDGVVGIHKGRADRSLVEGAIAVTQSRMEQLAGQFQGDDREALQDDYDKVMRVMNQLQKQADKKVRVGGLKIGLGSLMIVSAALGPEAPPILGVIGMVGTGGTMVYEHWTPIKNFLTGSSDKVPTFLDILPDKDRVVIHLEPR